MPIAGQRLRQTQLTHHDEAAAIGERIAVTGMTAEKCLGRLESLWPDPLDPQAMALLDQLEYPSCELRAAARLGECRRFVDDVIGDYQPSPVTQQPAHRNSRCAMSGIIAIDERVKS